jgi:hypothetical protein
MEKQVLTQEEIQSLKDLQQNQITLTQTLGNLEYNIQVLELEKTVLKQQLVKQIEEEINVGKQLQQKYGDGNIDLEKGEFIPIS